VELAQSRSEQRDYLKNVELARVLDKRVERKKAAAEKAGQPLDSATTLLKRPRPREGGKEEQKKVKKVKTSDRPPVDHAVGRASLSGVLDSIF
jgi:ESF2/ABP1 family protein